MSSERHLAGPCEGVSTLRDGSTTTIRFRSEEEARAFDYKLCDALYKALQTPAQPAQDHTAIPEDVMEAARAAHADYARSSVTDNLTTIIARAIMAATEAERERCGGTLRMIVSHATMGQTDGAGMNVNDICVQITAIRNEMYRAGQAHASTIEALTAQLDALKEENERLKAPSPHADVIGWIYEDELPKSYPYEAMFRHSKVDGVRIFPVFAPASQPNVPPIGDNHPDALAVDRFAAAMKAKLAEKRAEGRSGWDDEEDCSRLFLSQLLREHVEKGDPIDVGNFAMMLHQREERIASLLETLQGE